MNARARLRARLPGALAIAMIAVPLLFMVAFFVYPVAQLLGLSFLRADWSVDFGNFRRLIDTPVYFSVLITTFKIAGLTTIASIVLAYPIAYYLAKAPERRRNALLFWVLVPFWTSTLVRTFSWIVILGRNGPINQLLQGAGVADEPLRLLGNLFAVVVGMTHALAPLAVLTMLPVMLALPDNLTRAAGIMGARDSQAFWRIYFPLSMPGVAAAALSVFITALGFFITPTLLGGVRETILPQVLIEQIQSTLNWGFAATVAIMLLLVSIVVFVAYDWIVGMSSMSGGPAAASGGGKRRIGRLFARLGTAIGNAMGDLCAGVAEFKDCVLPPRRAARRPLPTALGAATAVLLFFLAAPAFFIVLVSFTEQSFINWPPVGFSWQWYADVFSSSLWIDAAIRSLLVGLATGLVATLLGTGVAIVLMRHDFPGKSVLMTLFILPSILPRIIIAVGLFYMFARIGLVGSMIGLVIGHTVLAVPFVVITVMAMMKGYDLRLDQAAATLGATPLTTFLRITLPIIRPGLISAFLFAFVVSFDELTIALFTTGGLSATLPKVMWDDALLKVNPTLAAVSGLMLVVLTTAIIGGEYLRRRAGRV